MEICIWKATPTIELKLKMELKATILVQRYILYFRAFYIQRDSVKKFF